MNKINFFCLLASFFLFSCNNGTDKKSTTGEAIHTPPIQPPKIVTDIEPGFSKADSLQILYYDDPDGDSLRYTRFFTYTETADTTQVKALLNEINQMYVQEQGARPCRSEGKLYVLKGADILKTVYFSTHGDSCRYFYFIKDGSFIYIPVTKTAESLLKQYKQKARKPRNAS